MKTEIVRLTRGRAQQLIRLSGFVGVTCAIVGILLLLIPPPKLPALKDIAQAAPRRFVNYTLLFPKYRDLASLRATPFEFQELVRIQVKLREKDPIPPPPPKPDVAGLILVGTAPGTPNALAVLLDEQNGQLTTIRLEDEVRNSLVKNIHADKIVLALDAEETELALTSIQGSENLQRQLQGLPPLPGQQTSEKKKTPHRTSSIPTQTSGSAILVGASGSGQMQSTVVTQSAPSQRNKSQQSRQSGRPGSPSQSGTKSSSSNQNSSAGQSGSGAMQNQGASPQRQPSNRSLGISGFMLSLEKQQELGLKQTGLLITSVRDSSSPILANDVILTVGGKAFGSLGEAKNLLQSIQGNTAQLKVFRNGAPTQISAPIK